MKRTRELALNVRVSAEEMKMARAEAARLGISVSGLIRMLIRCQWQKAKPLLKPKTRTVKR